MVGRIRLLILFLMKKCARFFPDRLYLSIVYYLRLGRRLNLDNPQLFTEKLQWLKLYYHRPECTVMVDKHLAKQWVADRIGDKYVIPSLAVWNRAEDIDIDALPDQFVLKCTHDNGSVVVCKDKATFNLRAAQEKLNRCLRRDFYAQTREWPYKHVPHRIIAEAYLDAGEEDLMDYKFLCFNGLPKAMYVAANRSTCKTFNYYDMDFQPMPIKSRVGATSKERLARPSSFDEMKRIAAELSAGFPHVRVDLYCVRNRIWWGEMTFFDSSGYDDMCSLSWDRAFGAWLDLPPKWVAE